MNRYKARLVHAARVALRLALGTSAALAWSYAASARCVFEKPALALSYPDASTVAVPPDAVLWLVPKLGSVQARFDGVELSPLGSSPVERFQFKPAEPLAIGEHQIEVRISPVIAGDDSEPEDVQLRFMVADLPYRAGDVEPLQARRFSSSEPLPAPELPASCPESTFLSGQCDDILRPAYDWLTFAPIGEPLFYVLNGDQLVRVGCEQAAVGIWDEQSTVPHEVAAVLPTGVYAARVLEGGPSLEAGAGSSDAASGCATAPAQRHSSPTWVIGAALMALVRRRPR